VRLVAAHGVDAQLLVKIFGQTGVAQLLGEHGGGGVGERREAVAGSAQLAQALRYIGMGWQLGEPGGEGLLFGVGEGPLLQHMGRHVEGRIGNGSEGEVAVRDRGHEGMLQQQAEPLVERGLVAKSCVDGQL